MLSGWAKNGRAIYEADAAARGVGWEKQIVMN
jgi:hypothetical protein